jgi:hypothetical protein
MELAVQLATSGFLRTAQNSLIVVIPTVGGKPAPNSKELRGLAVLHPSVASDLLEEELNVVPGASISDFADPHGMHRASVWSTLASNDDPLKLLPVGLCELIFKQDLSKERLHAEETHRGRHLQQHLDALSSAPLIFDACAHPHIL